MVKTIRIPLDDLEHEQLEKVKGKRTWYDVVLKGIKALEEEETQ